jgi:hypothetical protein
MYTVTNLVVTIVRFNTFLDRFTLPPNRIIQRLPLPVGLLYFPCPNERPCAFLSSFAAYLTRKFPATAGLRPALSGHRRPPPCRFTPSPTTSMHAGSSPRPAANIHVRPDYPDTALLLLHHPPPGPAHRSSRARDAASGPRAHGSCARCRPASAGARAH